MLQKKAYINGISKLFSIEAFQANKMIFITAGGIIFGSLCKSSDEDNSLAQKLLSTTNDEIMNRLNQTESFVIPLKNVTMLYPGNEIKSFEYLSLFSDQVIAVTLGDPQKQENVE